MSDGCQYDHPMVFCNVCGTWLHCSRGCGPDEYIRRPDPDNDEVVSKPPLSMREVLLRWMHRTKAKEN